MLYERDYKILTEEEKKIWERVESVYNKANKDGTISVLALNNYYKNLPISVLHYKQLFPNNFLNNDSLKEKEALKITLEEFKACIDSKVSEREIINFIQSRRCFFIITSIFKGFHFNFGHHGSFAFKEFELPPNYVVDYLLVGKNSDGYHFIFVELENAYGSITNTDGEFGTTIRKGIKQINDWDIWLESNYFSLRLVFNKYLGKLQDLPKEFYELDKTRIHYVIVAGRRDDYNKRTYLLKRKLLRTQNILLMHYDNLLDSAANLLKTGYY